MLGKHSGRHALRQAFADLGFTIEGDELKQAFVHFKAIADRKGKITSLDLEAIASDSLRERKQLYRLVSLAISTRTGERSVAEVTIDGTGRRADAPPAPATAPWTPRLPPSTS